MAAAVSMSAISNPSLGNYILARLATSAKGRVFFDILDASGHGEIGRRAGLYGDPTKPGARCIPVSSKIDVRVQVPLTGPPLSSLAGFSLADVLLSTGFTSPRTSIRCACGPLFSSAAWAPV